MNLLKGLKSCLQIVVGDKRRQDVEPEVGLASLFTLHRLKMNRKEEREGGVGREREESENMAAQETATIRQLSSIRLSEWANLYCELVKKMLLSLVIHFSSWLY